MAGSRNINTPSNPENASQNGMFLYGDKESGTFVARDVTPETAAGVTPPTFSGTTLSDFHVRNDGESNTKSKLIAGAVVALVIAVAAFYSISGTSAPTQSASQNNEPAMQSSEISTTPPAQQAQGDDVFTPSGM